MLARLAFPLVLCLVSGCAPGLIYTDQTSPLVTNMLNTPTGDTLAELDVRQLREPITALNLSAQWNSRASGEAAKHEGLTEIYYADLNTFSLLGGLWKQDTVRVWGRKDSETSPELK